MSAYRRKLNKLATDNRRMEKKWHEYQDEMLALDEQLRRTVNTDEVESLDIKLRLAAGKQRLCLNRETVNHLNRNLMKFQRRSKRMARRQARFESRMVQRGHASALLEGML